MGLHLPDFVFRDDEKLRIGQPVGDNLLNAIKRSKISIPVISEDYAGSKWCLIELIEIMDCYERRGQIVLPVFYKVKFEDVKTMEGKLGDAFRREKQRFDEEFEKKVKAALQKAVKLKVYKLEDYSGYEGKLVKALIEAIVLRQQYDFPPSFPKDLVGIDDHVARVMNLADAASPETQIIVIYGIGGIGKTTLATFIYKELFDNFDCHCRLDDIRETIKSKDMEYVQSLLASQITKRRVYDSGIEMIRRCCEKKKVLILLDDVHSRDHLDNLIGGCDFESGSRIIITCRDKALLKPEYKGYELKEMNREDSLLLFRKYAFEGEQPPIELVALSSDIVVTTGRIPLALVIIGSFLKRKDKSIWIETLEKLKKVPYIDVQQKLRISYDSLGYEEQQMFLDIACFFIGIDKRIVNYLWEDLQYCPNSGLERMFELSLMNVDDNNMLRMHDHLRDLGRAIARPADKKPWECSRLWDEEAITVQRSKEENRYVEALRLNEKGSIMFMERGSFERMPYLKFLRLSKVGFVKSVKDSLSELRWLEWENCPDSFVVTNVDLEKLLILNLSGCSINEKWLGWTSIKMEKLKVLNLSRCRCLKAIPNLSAIKSLERLNLEDCGGLEEIDPSIGDFKCLVSLNLRNCRKLKKLPDPQLGKLTNLEELFIDKTRIKEFPECIEFLKKLKMLSAVGCRQLNRVPRQLGEVKGLVSLNLEGCGELEELPGEMRELKELKELIICKTFIKKLPPRIGCLKKLTELDLSRTGISELPKSIGDLKNLQILRIVGCRYLRTLPSTICKLGKLEELDASYCTRLGGEIHIDGMSSVRILRLARTSISGLPNAIDKLSRLEKLDLSSCLELESLPQSISKLRSLQHLNLNDCRKLRLPRELPASLMVLKITCECPTLPPLSHLIHLKELTVTNCQSLESMPELPSGLLKLRVESCGKLEGLPSLSRLESLSELRLWQCRELAKIEGLEALKSLEELIVAGCPKEFDGLEDVVSLRRLTIDRPELDDPPWNDKKLSLVKMKNLEALTIRGWNSLERLVLSELATHLKHLSTEECRSLVKIEGLESLTNLESWNNQDCPSLAIPDRSCFPNISEAYWGDWHRRRR